MSEKLIQYHVIRRMFVPVQRAKSAKKVEKFSNARTITYSGVVKDLRDAGFTTIEINAITKALRLAK